MDLYPLRVRLSPGYCWPTSFKVLGVLYLAEVSLAFLPSKKACWTHKFRHLGVGQQYPPVSSTPAEQPNPGARSCTETQSTNQCQVGGCSGSFSTTCRQDRLATAIGGTLTVTTLADSAERRGFLPTFYPKSWSWGLPALRPEMATSRYSATISNPARMA